MTDRTTFRDFGKTAEKWRDLAEQRRAYFAELYRSGRWRLYYEEDKFLAHARVVAEVCERWTKIVEEHRQIVAEFQADPDLPRVRRNVA
jgi:uncharacterized repeat protein (TIGR03809 family)